MDPRVASQDSALIMNISNTADISNLYGILRFIYNLIIDWTWGIKKIHASEMTLNNPIQWEAYDGDRQEAGNQYI